MGAMATKRFYLLILPIATASLALAACGDDSSTGDSGDDQARFREAALEYTECMRRNGVDMPDPTFGQGGGINFTTPRRGEDDPAVRRAEEACRKYLEDVQPPELSEEQQRESRERALRYSRCMREHGIDFPDPTFGEDGRVELRLERGRVDENDPAFQEAQKACERYGPRVEEGS
jgi:hypothetical protein